MCGFVGSFGLPDVTPASEVVMRALHNMRQRGPDGEGIWAEGTCMLGHRRLAIIDLDPRAAQPMLSGCGRYVGAFNGEIYNYRDLRDRLADEGVHFRTTSDTEVLLELFARRGADALSELRGMFSIVVWDRHTQRAFIARDPYGIKPLYVAQTGSGVLVGSQVKALLATGLVSQEGCAEGQAGFWLLGSVPEPYTWFRDVRALPSGHYAWVSEGRMLPSKAWWNIADEWRTTDASASPALTRDGIREALRRSVAAHMVADVPVGVFLSGGIDSGALAGMMVEAGSRQLQGVTIAYDEYAGTPNDESPVASMVAAHYGIRHHVRRVSREEFENDLPKILQAMDQPSIDGINTWYASKAASELGLKVVVSGIGGDELFQGYESFTALPRVVSWWRRLSTVPGAQPLVRIASEFQARRTGNRRWRHFPDWAATMGGAWWLRRSLFPPEDVPALLGGGLSDALQSDHATDWIGRINQDLPSNPRLALSLIESTYYMRNQLLRDSDWASMAHSVELRTPFVDAWLLREIRPMLNDLERYPQKRLIAEAPSKPLPEELITRRKTGFCIPVDRWLRLAGQKNGGTHSQHWAVRVASEYSACP